MKIKDIGTVVTGKTPQTSHAEYYGGKYMFVTPQNYMGDIRCHTLKRLSPKKDLTA